MFKALYETKGDLSALVLRLVLAVVIFPHGAQKVLGWYGGPGFAATLKFFQGMGIPPALALLDMAAEFLGPIALLLGLMTRPAALGIGVVMAVAVLKVHLANGFFMNWTGRAAGEGFEYHLLAMGIAASLLLKGGGLLSLDRLIAPRRR